MVQGYNIELVSAASLESAYQPEFTPISSLSAQILSAFSLQPFSPKAEGLKLIFFCVIMEDLKEQTKL